MSVLVFGAAFYQSHLDKQKWKRINARRKPAATREPAKS